MADTVGIADDVVLGVVVVPELDTAVVIVPGLGTVPGAVAGGIADTLCLESTRLGLNTKTQLGLGLGLALGGLAVTKIWN